MRNLNDNSNNGRYRVKIMNTSTNANAILLVMDLKTAHILFMHSLNADSAIKMTDKGLLKLKGIGPMAVISIKMATKTAKKNSSQ